MAEGILWGALAIVVAMTMMRLFRRGKTEADERVALGDVHPYHCVGVTATSSACVAARKLQGQRFLANEAPRLPLQGCSSLDCTCVYAHFDDRRHHARRDPWSHQALAIEPEQVERRVSRGRRKTDGMYHPAN